MNLALTLPQLGWQAFFQQQFTLSEFELAPRYWLPITK